MKTAKGIALKYKQVGDLQDIVEFNDCVLAMEEYANQFKQPLSDERILEMLDKFLTNIFGQPINNVDELNFTGAEIKHLLKNLVKSHLTGGSGVREDLLFKAFRDGNDSACMEHENIKDYYNDWLDKNNIKHLPPKEETDTELLDWLQKIMTPKDNYCEIYFAGLRNGASDASSFQIEFNPEIYQTASAPTLREVIKKAMKQTIKL